MHEKDSSPAEARDPTSIEIAGEPLPAAETTWPDFDFSLTFSPQTASLANNSPWSVPGIHTPLQLNSDDSSNSSCNHGATPNRDVLQIGSVESVKQPTSDPGSLYTPDSEEHAVSANDIFQDFEEIDYDTLFLGLSEPSPNSAGDPFFGILPPHDEMEQTSDTHHWPAHDEFFGEIFEAPHDCMQAFSTRKMSLEEFIPDEVLQAHAMSPKPQEQRSPDRLDQHNVEVQQSRPSEVPLASRKRKRREFASEEREQVKQVRKQGACLRCRIYKEKCDLEIPCGKCREVLTTAKIFKQPCERLSLDEVVAFRAGNSRAGQTRSIFPKIRWSFDDQKIRTIYISENFVNPEGSPLPTMPISCRRFLPTATDVLIEPYEAPDGEVLLVTSTPFACFGIETQKMREEFEKYTNLCQPFAEAELFSSIGDEILKLGFKESRRYGQLHKESPVNLAAKIQSCVHIAVKQPIMNGSETLDIQPVNNPKFSIHGKAPVPNIIDYQIDTLIIHYMQRLMKELTKGLKKLIFSKNPTGNWYEIFLTIFVLISTLEHVYVAQISYLRRSLSINGDIYANINFVSRYMIEEWKASAKNLIYHFRCVLKAMVPFALSWTPQKQKHANLDNESLSYIKTMAALIDARKPELVKLRAEGLDNPRAQPLVWLVELFLDD